MSLDRASEEKKEKICYTTDFLLSLSELDVCRKLPGGFDPAILSEFEDGSGTIFERQKSVGGLSLQNSKRSEYGSSLPQNRSDNRGNQGRWDTRSTGSSDKDGDLLTEREDSGRRFGNQTRRSWQNPEHDGLLGSGAFPRPSGYAGASAPKGRGNGTYPLSRSTEAYQPPRPYKALPYSRREATDSFNDETFGSSECSNEDRAEEEKKRRASFELMRKEQQKSLQEKQNQKPGSHKENLDNDLFALLENSADEKSIKNRNKSDDSVASLVSHNDTSRSSLHAQAPASRPLVPPGFASALTEKNFHVQSSSTPISSEAGSVLIEDRHSVNCMDNDQDNRSNLASSKHANWQKNESKGPSVLFVDPNEKLEVPKSSTKVFNRIVCSEDASSKASCLQEANEVWRDSSVKDFSQKDEVRSEIVNSIGPDHSTTILEKLFSSALSKNYGSSPDNVEQQIAIPEEETWSPALPESSKFAHWFSEEEKKPAEDFSSRDLLSLIVSNEKVNLQGLTPNEKSHEHVPPNLPGENINTIPNLPTSPATSSAVGFPEQYSHDDKKAPSSVVLTCEDLEQSILAEVKDSIQSQQKPSQGTWISFKDKPEKQKVDVDDHASQHLLSLLQKGTCLNESLSSPVPGATEVSDRVATSDLKASLNPQVTENAVIRNPEIVQSSDQTLTLEALFGSAFMNALHSAEAPVSAQRGSVGTDNHSDVMRPHGIQFPCADDGFFPSTSDESRANMNFREKGMLAPNNTQNAKSHGVSGPWLAGSAGFSIEHSRVMDVRNEAGGAVEIHLPEEDSLITVGDTVIPVISDPYPFEDANKSEFSPEKPVEDISSKLLNAILRDAERSRTRVPDGPPLLHSNLYETVDPDHLYRHLHGRPSSQFPHHMNIRPSLPPLDHLAHKNPQMRLIGPDGRHHDPHHPFPANAIAHHAFSGVGGPRFDSAAAAAAHHPMLQHMAVPGNFPLHHPMQGLPRGMQPSHTMNHMPGYAPEMNNINNFPLHNRQPNYGGHGIGLPGGGGPHPEALERLLEMERRANTRQIPPVGGGHHHIPGIYGPEVDMNFRYR